MIAWGALKLLGFFPRLSATAARRLVIAALIVAAVIAAVALGTWLKGRYDRGVVEDARLEGNAEIQNGVAAANENASAGRVEDAVRARDEARALEGVIDNAPDPVAARREFYRCRRLQQQARAAGASPPTCVGSRLPAGAVSPLGSTTGL
jgi:hypothetical protein